MWKHLGSERTFNLVSTIIQMIKIVVPILLIIWGMLDFAKSVVAKKEEDIKKYQKAFVSRLISALVVFLIVVIVQFAVNLVSSVEEQSNEDGQDYYRCLGLYEENLSMELIVLMILKLMIILTHQMMNKNIS